MYQKLLIIPILLFFSSYEPLRHQVASIGDLQESKIKDAAQDRFLLLDDRIIDHFENAKLEVGIIKKHPANPLFGEDNPWEVRFDNLYGNIIYDQEEQIYKCWYSPFIQDESAKGMSLPARKSKDYKAPANREMAICYATSKDGITWNKPALNLVNFEGESANNILWRGGKERGNLWSGPHGAGVFKDLLEPDAERRYKAILKAEILSVAFSSNGINWNPSIACPTADVPGDTHNNAFWAPTLGKYVGITRDWGPYAGINGLSRQDELDLQSDLIEHSGKGGRQVARIESEDFVNWTKAEVVLEGIDLDHQTYSMPVFFYSGVYLGLLAIHEQSTDRVWTELTWSPDTKIWHRISPGVPLIANTHAELDYDWGCVYACATPVFLENEIRIYYGGSDWLHTSWRNAYLCMASMRPDGFAGYEQVSDLRPALMTTIGIEYAEKSIRLTADVEPGGQIRVSILDSTGREISRAKPVLHSVTDQSLEFTQPIDVDPIRLKLEWEKAKIYSFSFGD